MPSWPTTTDHGLRRRRPRDSRRPGADRACPATPVARRAAPSTPASAGRTRAATSGIDSPPGAHASSGRRRHVARTSPQRCSISDAMEALPFALADLEEARLRPHRDRPPEGELVGHRPADLVGGLRLRARAANGRSRSAGRSGIGRAGEACGWASRAATRSAWRRPIGESGESGLALEPALDDELRLAVADEDERRVEPAGTSGARPGRRATRSAVAAEPDHPQVEDRFVGPDLLGDGRRDVVVEGQDHEGVGARARTGRGASR